MIRDILKKAAVALMAVSVIGGAMVVENSTVAKAEDEAYTVNFHVKDDGQDFSQLTIKAYTNSNQGKDEAFEKKDGEGFYKFNFFRDPEDDVDNEISFVVQRDDGLKVSVLQDSVELASGNSMDIYITMEAVDKYTFTTEKPASWTGSADSSSDSPSVTSDNSSTSSSTEITVPKTKKAKALKVNFAVALILDIILFALISFACYAKFSKEQIHKYRK